MYPFYPFQYNISLNFFRQKWSPYFFRITSSRAWVWIIFYHFRLRWFISYWICHVFSHLFKDQLLLSFTSVKFMKGGAKRRIMPHVEGKEMTFVWKAGFILEMAAVWNCWQIGSVRNCPRPDGLLIWVQVNRSKALYKWWHLFLRRYHHNRVV